MEPDTQEQGVSEPTIGERADVFIKSQYGDQYLVSGDVVEATAEAFTIDCKIIGRTRRATYQRTTHVMRAAEIVDMTQASDTTPPIAPVYLTEWELRGTDESGE